MHSRGEAPKRGSFLTRLLRPREPVIPQATRRAIWLALACLLALLGPRFARAQALTGSIAGTVTDPSGARVPGVAVTAASTALITGTRVVTSDANGYFKFLELPPGTYDVKFEKTGFTTFSTKGIVVNSAVEVTANAKLQVGAVSQQVTVSAEPGTIDTEHVTAQTALGQDVMENIPTGRSPWALTNTVAGVMTSTYDVGGSSGTQEPSLSEHGSTNADKKYMFDGVNVNWPGGGGGSTFMYYDQGMFQETNYQVGALPADISQGGIFMNMVTKSGGNTVHGTIFLNGASEGMQSNNVNSTLAQQLLLNLPPAVRSQPGIRLGSPITETYDYNGEVGGPLLRDKLWWFTSLRAWTVNTLVSGSFNANGTQAINDNRLTNEMVKFDWQASQKNRFSIMYNRNQKNRFHRRNTPPFFISDQAAFLQNQFAGVGIGKWVFTPSTKWVIDAGVGYLRGKFPLRYESAVSPTDISVTDTGLSTLMNAAADNYINPNSRISLDSSASYVSSGWGGQHNVKFGWEYTHDYFAQLYHANGDLQGVLINGVATTATIYNTPIKQQTNLFTTNGLYVTDSWTVLRRLTLNLGLRWERIIGTVPHETSPAGTFVPARDIAEIDNVPNFKNLTPRFGLAWDVTGLGKTVIKAGASRYMQGVAAGDLTVAVNPLGFSTASVPWSCTGPSCANGPTLAQLNLSKFNGFVGGATTHIDPNLRRPYSWEYNAGLQQQLPAGIILSVTGWYRSTFDQIGRANLAVLPGDYTPFNITNPLTGQPLTVYNQNPATKGHVQNELTNSPALNTEYRGIDIDFTRRMTRNWQMLGGLTIGRFRGAWTGDINTTLDDLNNPNFGINRLGENSFDAPYEFKMAGTYRFPLGFEFSGDFQHVSGYPRQVTYTVTSKIDPGLTQVSQTIQLVPQGVLRLPNVNLADVRFSRIFSFKDRLKVQPEFDIYNLGNSGAATGAGSSANNLTLLGNPSSILQPRLYKVGIKVDF
ncbi:MAG TPA: TonB-dependent receptor [Candidatus Acidoferrales bacterium]|nr:TonB-dependent receptor [Candidatus Acidoferrales bacterium]